MEAHFNKDAGEPGRADFHRFVLLFLAMAFPTD